MHRLLSELRAEFGQIPGSAETLGGTLNRMIRRIDELDDDIRNLYKLMEVKHPREQPARYPDGMLREPSDPT